MNFIMGISLAYFVGCFITWSIMKKRVKEVEE